MQVVSPFNVDQFGALVVHSVSCTVVRAKGSGLDTLIYNLRSVVGVFEVPGSLLWFPKARCYQLL